MKTTARNAVFADSEDVQRARCRVSVFRGPAVSKTGVVSDMVETGVNIAELLADTLDEGAYIGAVPLRAVPGDKILAVDEIVDLAVADVLARLFGQQSHNPEFRQRQIDLSFRPQCAICAKAQHQLAQAERRCPYRFRLVSRRDQLQPL